MFSGIIEEVGTVVSYDGETLIVGANQVLNDLKISESIMVAGACLTVTELAEDGCIKFDNREAGPIDSDETLLDDVINYIRWCFDNDQS